jgi:hypothetical protein
MRATVVVVGVAWAALLAVLSPACGSSSGSGDDAGVDVKADKTPVDVATDKGSDALAKCNGLDAAASGLTFAPACLSCIGAHCCMEADTCAGDPACKPILACEATCVADGNAAMDCAVCCISSGGHDGGDTGSCDANEDVTLSSAQNAAKSLDLCLALNCSADCGG